MTEIRCPACNKLLFEAQLAPGSRIVLDCRRNSCRRRVLVVGDGPPRIFADRQLAPAS